MRKTLAAVVVLLALCSQGGVLRAQDDLDEVRTAVARDLEAELGRPPTCPEIDARVFAVAVREARRRGMMPPAGSMPLSCWPSRRFDCNPLGCGDMLPGDHRLELGPDAWWLASTARSRVPAEAVVRRCDDSGCDAYDMIPAVSGGVVSFTLPGPSPWFVRILRDGLAEGPSAVRRGAFVEVIAIGTHLLTYHGVCQLPDLQ